MCDPELNSRLDLPINSLSCHFYEKMKFPSLNQFIYLDNEKDSWSHLLSMECGCHYWLPEIETISDVGYALHNMTEHLNYSIYEVIYATDFKCNIKFELIDS